MANLFDIALEQEGVTGPLAELARSIYMQESGGGKNTTTSNAGAVGGMQIIPSTFASMADKDWDINNPEQNARAGLRYIKRLNQVSGGDPMLTAVGYYGGEGAIDKARQGIAVFDPRNPNAPSTLQYGKQVIDRLASTTTSDSNPVGVSNNDPFAELNKKYLRNAEQPAPQSDPFAELNAKYALPEAAPYTAPATPTQPTSSVMGDIQAIPRMLKLTGRAAIEGVGSALSAPTEPTRMALEAISTKFGGPRVASAETMATKLANLLQLPKPVEKSVMDNTGQAERFGFDVAKTGFSAIPMMGGAKALAPLVGGKSQTILQQLAANPAMQGISAAGAGAGGSVAREYGSPPEVELLASILAGVAAPTAVAPIGSGIKAAVTAAGSKIAPTRFGVQPEQIDELITSSLGRSGFDFSKVPDQIKTALRNDVGNALRTGGKFDEDAMRRLFDIRMIEGATPTKGMITLDPRQVTLEQNLAKTGINSTDTNLQQLGQIQNANNQALINALNQRGAGKTDLFAAGQANIGNISAADAARQAATSSLYKQAEGILRRSAAIKSQ